VKKETIKIKPGPARDELMVRLINGATKSSVTKDKKKEASRSKARKKLEESEDGD
jgi:hypothetical protein